MPASSSTRDAAAGDPLPPLPRQAGAPVLGTAVFLPASGKAGSRIVGEAPPGSVVTYGTERLIVGAEGRFTLSLPASPARHLDVRVERPHLSALAFRVRIEF